MYFCIVFSIVSFLINFAVSLDHSFSSGRVSLTQGASLVVDDLTVEDEGWFECRILLLDRSADEFRNGTWTFLSITGLIPYSLRN